MKRQALVLELMLMQIRSPSGLLSQPPVHALYQSAINVTEVHSDQGPQSLFTQDGGKKMQGLLP